MPSPWDIDPNEPADLTKETKIRYGINSLQPQPYLSKDNNGLLQRIASDMGLPKGASPKVGWDPELTKEPTTGGAYTMATNKIDSVYLVNFNY